MRWKVKLEGHDVGLSDLANSFSDDPRIFRENEEYFLWSSCFEQMNNYLDVLEISREIIDTIRSFGGLDGIWLEGLDVRRIHEITDDGAENLYTLPDSTSILVKGGARRVTNEDGDEIPEYYPANPTYERTQLALEDEKVRELASILEKGHNWVNLFRIYEFIRDNIEGDKNIVEQGWWTRNKESLFTYTANSRGAIGNEARHAKKRKPPDDPMNHAVAKYQIEILINNWIQHRRDLN